MKIALFTHDIPFPVNHGFRLDSFKRIQGLKQLNHEIFMVGWAFYEDNLSEESHQEILKHVKELVVLSRSKSSWKKVKGFISKAARLAYQPSVVTDCNLEEKSTRDIEKNLEKFNPDLFFVESIYFAKTAFRIAKKLNKPVFIRSHNIEHQYLQDMISKSGSFYNKLKYWAMSAHIEKYEQFVLGNCDAFFDISLSDLDFWKSKGLNNGYWMPTTFEKPVSTDAEHAIAHFDIGYIGNLFTPNNVESVEWFIQHSLPAIEKAMPGVKVLIAGARPAPELVELINKHSCITLIANPPNVTDFYHKTKVIINPIIAGSGVKIKSIEMLYLAKNAVCTAKAIEGLPKEFHQVFSIMPRNNEFAEEILSLVKNPKPVDQSLKDDLKKFFEVQYLENSLKRMVKSHSVLTPPVQFN